MSVKSRSQLKQAFSQGAWPQASDYADMMDSFALVGEIPSGQDGSVRQQVVEVPAGTVGNGARYAIEHQLGKYPIVNVYVKTDGMLRRIDDVTVELKGTTVVAVTVKSQTVDVLQTGMTIILN